MSKHCNWVDVPLRVIVDGVLEVAEAHGAAEVFVHGPVLRICKPCTHSASDYDNYCGEYRRGLSRAKVTEMLLAAFILAVTDR